MDQQGVLVVIGSDCTYEVKGSSQIDIAGRDEKRMYTLCMGSSAAGDFLPQQQIWGGKSERSLPKRSPDRDAAEKKGIHFAFAESTKGRSHFSTLKTMKEVSCYKY
jgi:hypothetical protein